MTHPTIPAASMQSSRRCKLLHSLLHAGSSAVVEREQAAADSSSNRRLIARLVGRPEQRSVR